MSRPPYSYANLANPAEPFWSEQAGPPQEVTLKPYPNVPQNTLDAEILGEMHRSQIAGISAAFVKDNRVVWANGYGWADLEKSRPVGPDTIYRIASISKTITATALMQLWELGLFRLDSDISSYLGYPVRNPHYPDDKITFHMLLTHTSSILDSGGYAAALSSPHPPLLSELLVPGSEAYSSLTWGDYRPGTQFNYSNFGVGIIGALVEILSGERFDQYAINHIFGPLGMDASYVPADIVNYEKIAILYKTSGNSKFYPACDYYPEGQRPARRAYQYPLGNYYIGPAGAVRANALDLAKFMLAHMNGGSYDGVRILRRDTVDLIQQIHWYGFGLEGLFRQMGLIFHITDTLAGRRLTGHAGEACGLVSDMYFNRGENNGIILMTNGGYYQFLRSGYTNIEEAVFNRIYAQLAGPTRPLPRVVTAVPGVSKLVVNGRQIFYPVTPDVQAGDFFIPALSLADALKTTIEFERDTLTLSKGFNTLTALVGEPYLFINDNPIKLESPIYTKEGYIMLPLIKVSEAFGASVSYTPAGNIIVKLA